MQIVQRIVANPSEATVEMINFLNDEEIRVINRNLVQEEKLNDFPEPVSGEVFRRMAPILGGIGSGAAAARAAREAH